MAHIEAAFLEVYAAKHTTWIVPLTAMAIAMRDNGCCQYCLKFLFDRDSNTGTIDTSNITLDHVISKWEYKYLLTDMERLNMGSVNRPTNLVLACRHCNSKKQNYKVSEVFPDLKVQVRIHKQTKQDIRPFLRQAKALLRPA